MYRLNWTVFLSLYYGRPSGASSCFVWFLLLFPPRPARPVSALSWRCFSSPFPSFPPSSSCSVSFLCGCTYFSVWVRGILRTGGVQFLSQKFPEVAHLGPHVSHPEIPTVHSLKNITCTPTVEPLFRSVPCLLYFRFPLFLELLSTSDSVSIYLGWVRLSCDHYEIPGGQFVGDNRSID